MGACPTSRKKLIPIQPGAYAFPITGEFEIGPTDEAALSVKGFTSPLPVIVTPRFSAELLVFDEWEDPVQELSPLGMIRFNRHVGRIRKAGFRTIAGFVD